jgi:hypothetical protein
MTLWHRRDLLPNDLEEMRGGLVAINDGSEKSTYYHCYEETDFTKFGLAKGPALNGGGLDNFDVATAGGNRSVSVTFTYTATSTGTVSLEWYSATYDDTTDTYAVEHSSLPFDRSSATDEGRENAIELMECAVTTEGFYSPIEHIGIDSFEGRDFGDGVQSTDLITLPRTRYTAGGNEEATQACLAFTIRKSGETAELSGKEVHPITAPVIHARSGWGHTAAQRPYTWKTSRFGDLFQRLLYSAKARNSGKWYWELEIYTDQVGRTLGNDPFVFGIAEQGFNGSQNRDEELALGTTSDEGIFYMSGNIIVNGTDFDLTYADFGESTSNGATAGNWMGIKWDADNAIIEYIVGNSSGSSTLKRTNAAGPVITNALDYDDGNTYRQGKYFRPVFAMGDERYSYMWRLSSDAGMKGTVPPGYTVWGDA